VKKQFMIGLMVLGMAVLFSGCTVKTGSCPIEVGEKKEGAIYAVSGKNTFPGPSDGHNKRTRNIHALQNAATLTLSKGFSHFSIVNWGPEINNAKGSMMNTAKEFVDKCAPSSLNPFTVGNHLCGIKTDTQFLVLRIAVFTKEQHDMLTYNASEVKSYLEENGLWRNDGIERTLNNCDKYLGLEY
jgi:hypothetical protein